MCQRVLNRSNRTLQSWFTPSALAVCIMFSFKDAPLHGQLFCISQETDVAFDSICYLQIGLEHHRTAFAANVIIFVGAGDWRKINLIQSAPRFELIGFLIYDFLSKPTAPLIAIILGVGSAMCSVVGFYKKPSQYVYGSNLILPTSPVNSDCTRLIN